MPDEKDKNGSFRIKYANMAFILAIVSYAIAAIIQVTYIRADVNHTREQLRDIATDVEDLKRFIYRRAN